MGNYWLGSGPPTDSILDFRQQRRLGESTWANDGEHWLIQASNVLPDGSRSTAEHVLTRVDDNNFPGNRRTEP